jgi:hypothetical protein
MNVKQKLSILFWYKRNKGTGDGKSRKSVTDQQYFSKGSLCNPFAQ